MSFQIAALAGATALSAVGSISGGYAQARGLRSQAGQYAAAQQDSKVQTLQEEVARRRRFMEMTGTNQLDLAGRGVTSDSDSFEAIEAENRRRAEMDISNARFLGDQRTRQLGLAAHMSNRAASNAIRGGWISAGITVLNSAYKAFGGMSGGAPDTGGSAAGTQAYGSRASDVASPTLYGGPR